MMTKAKRTNGSGDQKAPQNISKGRRLVRRFFLWRILGAGFLGLCLALYVFWPDNLVIKGPMLDFILARQVKPIEAGALKQVLKPAAGFQVRYFAQGLENPRMMRLTAKGDVIVSEARAGRITLLFAGADKDGPSTGRKVLLEGLALPHGLALDGHYLYVAEEGQVSRFPFDAEERKIGAREQLAILPTGGWHKTRSLGLSPDGLVYVSVGSSCNVCLEENPHRAAILRLLPNQGLEIVATGLRNSVGFDWDSEGRLYATDNGRDLLGDERPSDELNHIEMGKDYGWPFSYDDRQADPDFGDAGGAKIAASTVAVHGFGGHRAPLGIDFIDHNAALKGSALVALHGSWNRSSLAGYKVVRLDFTPDGKIVESDFLTGFEKDGQVFGRPVDIEESLDGRLYVSDDYSGSIYLISPQEGEDGVLSAGLDLTQGSDALGVSRKEQTTAAIKALLAKQQDPQAFLQSGARLYREYGCRACHGLLPPDNEQAGADRMASGPAAKGDDPEGPSPEAVIVKNLVDLNARYDLAALLALFKNPPGIMPRFPFSEEEAEKLAVYLLDQPAAP